MSDLYALYFDNQGQVVNSPVLGICRLCSVENAFALSSPQAFVLTKYGPLKIKLAAHNHANKA